MTTKRRETAGGRAIQGGPGALADDLDTLDQALERARAPQLRAAAEGYRRALADPKHYADSVHALGMIAMRLQRLTVAERLIRAAIEADPGRPDFVGNLGNVLKDLGRFDAAIACYRKVLAAAPGSEVAFNNLANTLQEQGALDEAIAGYRRAVELKPDYVDAWTNLGNTLQKRDRADEAVTAYRRALGINPRFAEAWLNLGAARHLQGKHEDAVACLNRALQIRPKSINAYNKLQRVHLELGDYDEVLRLARTIRAHAPRNQMTVACEAFARLAAGDVATFRALYAMEGLPCARQLEPPSGYPDAAAFNEALVAELLAHPNLKWIHDTYDTTRRGFVYGLLDEPPPAMEAFGRLLHARIEEFRSSLSPVAAHPFLGNIPQDFTIKLWATILNGGGYHPPHHHEHNWLSGTYYIKVPRSCRPDSADRAGWIEFDGFTDLPGLSGHGEFVRHIAPVEGLLVLFPSYFMHGTVPFAGDDTRIGFAFDVAPA